MQALFFKRYKIKQNNNIIIKQNQKMKSNGTRNRKRIILQFQKNNIQGHDNIVGSVQ